MVVTISNSKCPQSIYLAYQCLYFCRIDSPKLRLLVQIFSELVEAIYIPTSIYEFTLLILFFFFFFFVFLPFLGPLPSAYGGSQARGRIGAVATGLRQNHSNAGSDHHHSSRQRRILNPMSKARNQTRNLMVPSRIR